MEERRLVSVRNLVDQEQNENACVHLTVEESERNSTELSDGTSGELHIEHVEQEYLADVRDIANQ